MVKMLSICFRFLPFIFLGFASISFAAKAEDVQKLDRFSEYENDTHSEDEYNPLNKFTTFTVFNICPATGVESQKIHNLVKNELGKYGRVKKVKLINKRHGVEVIDFKNFCNDGYLIYEIRNVVSSTGEELPFVEASLNLKTSVVINKNKLIHSPYIWSKSCFLPGKVDKDLDMLVLSSLEQLLSEFNASYLNANSKQPTFYLYQ